MAHIEEDISTSIAAVLADPNGGILVNLISTDFESFYSTLTPILDVEDVVENAVSEELYGGEFWLVDLHRCEGTGALFACDSDGNVHTNASGIWKIEPVTDAGLRVIRCLPDGSVITAGTDGIVYRREEESWSAISQSFGQWITGMDGRSQNEITISGDAGLVAQYHRKEWHIVDLPTNSTFNTVLALPDAYLVGGSKGTLFRGDGESWVDLTSGSADVHDLAIYKEQIWVACGTAGVGQLMDDSIEIVRDTFAAFIIHAAGNYLALAGNDIAMRFDGERYKGRRYG